jgi:hypothetical protein
VDTLMMRWPERRHWTRTGHTLDTHWTSRSSTAIYDMCLTRGNETRSRRKEERWRLRL